MLVHKYAFKITCTQRLMDARFEPHVYVTRVSLTCFSWNVGGGNAVLLVARKNQEIEHFPLLPKKLGKSSTI